jgi:hypothetical protein
MTDWIQTIHRGWMSPRKSSLDLSKMLQATTYLLTTQITHTRATLTMLQLTTL